METIFMNAENSKTNEPYRFRLTLADKINLKDPNKNITHGEIISLHITTINLKSLLQLGMMNLTCLMDHILFQTFRIISSRLLKNMKL